MEKRAGDFGEEISGIAKKIGKEIEGKKTGKAKDPEGKPKTKRLYRSGKERILGGVCGGIAEYLDLDPLIVRLLWALFVLFYGIGALLYIIAWIFIPRNPSDKWN